jgi:hypothetical protein
MVKETELSGCGDGGDGDGCGGDGIGEYCELTLWYWRKRKVIKILTSVEEKVVRLDLKFERAILFCDDRNQGRMWLFIGLCCVGCLCK